MPRRPVANLPVEVGATAGARVEHHRPGLVLDAAGAARGAAGVSERHPPRILVDEQLAAAAIERLQLDVRPAAHLAELREAEAALAATAHLDVPVERLHL